MLRKSILSTVAVSVVIAGMFSAVEAKADGIVSFDVGDSHICLGVWSCLFHAAPSGERDSDNTKDHRSNTTDHRDIEDRSNTVVVIKPKIRDHRTKITVRDHRN